MGCIRFCTYESTNNVEEVIQRNFYSSTSLALCFEGNPANANPNPQVVRSRLERAIDPSPHEFSTMSSTPDADVNEEGSEVIGPYDVADETSVDVLAHTDAKDFRQHLQKFTHTACETAQHGTPRTSHRLTRKRPNDYKEDEERAESTNGGSLKRRRQSSKYAPPSKYAHLPKLTDILEPNLIAIFVGFNPGIRTATTGHAYAHPSNMFWKLLHSSGCTETRLRPEQDVDLPLLCSLGNTNLVERPSKDVGELSKAEMAAGTEALEEKVRQFRPEAVCIVGKTIWQSIWRWRYKREMKRAEFKYGWQDAKQRMGKTTDWKGAWVFVATATSGLSASTKPHEKEAIWKPFGEWVQQRRQHRALASS